MMGEVVSALEGRIRVRGRLRFPPASKSGSRGGAGGSTGRGGGGVRGASLTLCWPRRGCFAAQPPRWVGGGPRRAEAPCPPLHSGQVPTVVDYKDVLLTLVPMAPRTQHLCSFLCELSLLHTSLAAYAPALLATAALLLARLTHGQSKEPVLAARAWAGPEVWGMGAVGRRCSNSRRWREKSCIQVLGTL